jgi:hypothetical protein
VIGADMQSAVNLLWNAKKVYGVIESRVGMVGYTFFEK